MKNYGDPSSANKKSNKLAALLITIVFILIVQIILSTVSFYFLHKQLININKQVGNINLEFNGSSDMKTRVKRRDGAVGRPHNNWAEKDPNVAWILDTCLPCSQECLPRYTSSGRRMVKRDRSPSLDITDCEICQANHDCPKRRDADQGKEAHGIRSFKGGIIGLDDIE